MVEMSVWCVDDPLWMGGTSGGRGGCKWHQPHTNSCEPCKYLILAFAVALAKTNKKSTFLRRNALYCVVIASICSEKTHLKKFCVPTLYESATALSDNRNTTFFSGCQNLTSAMKLGQKSDGRLQI